MLTMSSSDSEKDLKALLPHAFSTLEVLTLVSDILLFETPVQCENESLFIAFNEDEAFNT